MKKQLLRTSFINLTVMCLCVSVTACSQSANDLEKTEGDPELNGMAIAFVNDFFSTMKNGSAYNFSEKGTDMMVKNLTPEIQKKVYDDISRECGEFIKAAYAETYVQKSAPDFRILRLKADFSDCDKKWELRVVYDNDKKIAGYWIKPWNDVLM